MTDYDPAQSLKDFIDTLIADYVDIAERLAQEIGQNPLNYCPLPDLDYWDALKGQLQNQARDHVNGLVSTIQPSWFVDGVATTVLYTADDNGLHETLVQLEKRDRRRIVSVERLSPFVSISTGPAIKHYADWLIVHYPNSGDRQTKAAAAVS